MAEDPIVEEVRRHRQAHAAKHGNDLTKICDALREREARSERPVVNRSPRVVMRKTGS